jgi:hypothetical protein
MRARSTASQLQNHGNYRSKNGLRKRQQAHEDWEQKMFTPGRLRTVASMYYAGASFPALKEAVQVPESVLGKMIQAVKREGSLYVSCTPARASQPHSA